METYTSQPNTRESEHLTVKEKVEALEGKLFLEPVPIEVAASGTIADKEAQVLLKGFNVIKPELTIPEAQQVMETLPEKKAKCKKSKYRVYDKLHEQLIDIYNRAVYWTEDKEMVNMSDLFVKSFSEYNLLKAHRKSVENHSAMLSKAGIDDMTRKTNVFFAMFKKK